jgi:serine/threonine-protein kinase
MQLTPGAIIAGRYRVEQKVGAGGMGEVWAGHHRAVGTRVAIKTLLSAAALNHEVVARFKREAYILGQIRSDHVARVVDFIEDKDYGLVLVMEFVDGDSLAQTLTTRRFTVEETIELGVDMARALIDLHHANIIHRDLKPGNIILQRIHGKRRRRAVLVDFGVSRLNSRDVEPDDELTGITKADMAVGTIEYMAPEQILDSRSVTGASDIYATGAILYRVVAGQHVFSGPTSDSSLAQKKLTIEAPPLSLNRDDNLAKGLCMVVTRALKRRLSERYKTAEQLLDDLLPLRDLARVNQLDVDSATVEKKPILEALLASTAHGRPLSRKSSEAKAAVSEIAASSGAETSLGGPDVDLSVDLFHERRGLIIAVMVGTVLLALAGGIVLFQAGDKRPPGTTPVTTSAPTALSAPTAPAASPAAQREQAAPRP